MLLIEDSWDLNGLYADGILGMAPTSQSGKADLVVKKLWEQGAIPESVFSFQIGDLDEKSVVTIGGYDVEKYARENETLQWHNLTNKFWWTLKLEGAQLDGKALPIRTTQVIIDTGTSFTLVPKTDYRIITSFFYSKGYDCKTDRSMYNLFVCQCTDAEYASYPTLEVIMGGTAYKLAPINYIERQEGVCAFKFMTMEMSGPRAFWIMGIPFFQNYYTVFDLQNQRVGFAESKISSLQAKNSSVVEEPKIEEPAVPADPVIEDPVIDRDPLANETESFNTTLSAASRFNLQEFDDLIDEDEDKPIYHSKNSTWNGYPTVYCPTAATFAYIILGLMAFLGLCELIRFYKN